MADLASFSLSDRRAAPHSRAHQYRLTAVSAVIQSAARLERGRTLNNVRGRQGRGGEGGEGTVHTFHKPEPLWPRSLAGHPLRGWPASEDDSQDENERVQYFYCFWTHSSPLVNIDKLNCTAWSTLMLHAWRHLVEHHTILGTSFPVSQLLLVDPIWINKWNNCFRNCPIHSQVTINKYLSQCLTYKIDKLIKYIFGHSKT